MKKLLILSGIIMTCFGTAVAQEQKQSISGLQNYWKYSPSLTEDELYDTFRLLNMSKEDWDLFRQDPRFDEQKVREVKKAHKEKLDLDGITKKMMPDESCSCWVEPNFGYVTSDPNNWPNCAGGAGAGVDCWLGPLDLPFEFCYYGNTYDQIVITSKGTIVFANEGYYDWTPSEFPIPTNGGEPQYDHICPFWADFDFTESGLIYYLIDDNAFYLNYFEAGYWSGNYDRVNTMQCIITANDAGILSEGNNVQFCYVDMNFAHGDVGGNGGCGGPTPANAGADKSSGNSHIQFGRFNICDSQVYNGPYGQANNEVDGVDWLDGKSFEFNTCASGGNIPPLATAAAPCDTLFVCLNDTLDLSSQFLAPENGQVVQVTWTEVDGLFANGQNGNTATFNGYFVGSDDNVGTWEVTVTATDNGNPSEQTIYTYIITVLPIELPPLTIDGITAVCAGGTTTLTASDGYDSYDWDVNGCSDQVCVTGSGTHTVVGQLSECFNTAEITVVATPFEYVDFTVEQNPICEGEFTTVCVDFPEDYVSFLWSAYPDYCADITTDSDLTSPCITVGGDCESHLYILATDSNGCVDFNIPVVFILDSFIDDVNDQYNDAVFCEEELEPVEFVGGYSSPADGFLNIYCISSDPTGWQGSYVIVTITPCNPDDPPYDEICLTGDVFEYFSIPIAYCDQITVDYVSSGVGDAFNSVSIFNCSNQNPINLGPGLVDGILWEGESGCEAEPLPGTWTVVGPPGWTFTTTSLYNPFPDPNVFTPGGYGEYVLTFQDPACPDNNTVYNLEYNLPPSIEISPSTAQLLCDNGVINATTDAFEGYASYDYSWSGQGVDPTPGGQEAVIGPYTGYVIDQVITVTIENNCGEESDSFTVTHHPDVPEPLLDVDDLICDDESVLLDPIPSASDSPYLEYDWSTGETTASINADQSDEYCVTVSNQCDESNEECVEFVIVSADDVNAPPAYNLECVDGEVQLCVGDIDAGYVIVWSSGSTNDCITVTESGTYTYSVTDTQNCGTLTTGSADVVINYPATVGEGSDEADILCPGESVTLDLSSTYASGFTWTTSCDEYEVSGGNSVVIASDQVALECFGEPIVVTGTATNVCNTGGSSASWSFIVDPCTITIPNVITPNTLDSLNSTFYIVGLENYEGAKLKIFDRWGSEIYSADDYQNDWGPTDLTGGTYYFTLKLPYGTRTDIEGYFTILN